MGSRSTKLAAPPHTVATTLPVTHAQQHHKSSTNTNEIRSYQGHVYQAAQATMASPQAFDDISLNPATQSTNTSRRRFSEPTQIADMSTKVNADGIRHLDAFESFIVQRDLMSIDVDYTAPISSVPVEHDPTSANPSHTIEESKEPKEPQEVCVGCCTQLPKKTDLMYAQEVIRPCRSCDSTYCALCVKNMFIDACRDSTRMPPRCCVQIHLHHIKSHLTIYEITEYKSKYEEWSTPKPFYCPKPTCSVFIPERILPPQAGTKGKRKVDSGVGTPTSVNFACPRCECEICLDCRQVAHPGSLCASLDLGVDADTAALLKAWGYKRCPKCSQGLKRMYGCNHMECRCGAHFCWSCLKSRDECEGGCYEDDDEDYNSDSEPDEPEPLPTQGSDTELVAGGEQMTPKEGSMVTAQVSGEATDDVVATSGIDHRPRNLDGGSARYWENRDFDFGDEPNDSTQNQVWDCYHSFEPYTVSLSALISQDSSIHEMECVRCWCTIRSEIETPRRTGNVPGKTTSSARPSVTHGGIRRRGTIVSGYARRGRNTRRRYLHGNVARPGPVGYVPPRGLFHSDATVGTAPHLIAPLSPLKINEADLLPEIMEDIRAEADLNVVMNTGETELASSAWVSEMRKTAPSSSNFFDNRVSAYSIALECDSCNLIVCKKCGDDLLSRRQAEQDIEEAEQAAEEAGQVAEEAGQVAEEAEQTNEEAEQTDEEAEQAVRK